MINNGVFEGYFANGLNQYTGVGGLNPAYNDGNFNLTGFNGATYLYGYTSQLISASKGGNSVQWKLKGTATGSLDCARDDYVGVA